MSNEDVVSPLYGRTDTDVIDADGNLIAIGGAAKSDLGKLGRVLRIYKEEAGRRGVLAKAYFTSDTPESVLAYARGVLGDDNVATFN